MITLTIVEIDVSKENSTVAILRYDGRLCKKPFVAVINPLVLKRWRTQNLRMVKTDKQDAVAIAHYGCEKWFRLQNFSMDSKVYQDLKLLGRQYAHYMEMGKAKRLFTKRGKSQSRLCSSYRSYSLA